MQHPALALLSVFESGGVAFKNGGPIYITFAFQLVLSPADALLISGTAPMYGNCLPATPPWRRTLECSSPTDRRLRLDGCATVDYSVAGDQLVLTVAVGTPCPGSAPPPNRPTPLRNSTPLHASVSSNCLQPHHRPTSETASIHHVAVLRSRTNGLQQGPDIVGGSRRCRARCSMGRSRCQPGRVLVSGSECPWNDRYQHLPTPSSTVIRRTDLTRTTQTFAVSDCSGAQPAGAAASADARVSPSTPDTSSKGWGQESAEDVSG